MYLNLWSINKSSELIFECIKFKVSQIANQSINCYLPFVEFHLLVLVRYLKGRKI